jgi:RES domain-containing protein
VAGALVWRIARRAHALDGRGAGARTDGGRWNEAGTPVIYAGVTIAIAALEKFVHVAGIVPVDLVLVRIELPTRCSAEKPKLGDLPRDWDSVPPAASSMAFGTKWARESRSLVLYVPSALIPEELNAVLNPSHPEFGGVKMTVQRPFHYDARMYS